MPKVTNKANGEGWVDDAIQILHDIIPHTPLKIEETNGTKYDEGYIFYQNMVIRNVKEKEENLVALIRSLVSEAEARARERAAKIVEDMMEDHEHWKPIVNAILSAPSKE